MNKKWKIIFIVLLLLSMLFISIAFYTTFRLRRFKQCYDNDFELSYCEKYKNY